MLQYIYGAAELHRLVAIALFETAAMVQIQHLIGPAPFPAQLVSPSCDNLSVISYNVLLPNSVDGWWNYKMYLPPLTPEQKVWSTWEYRRELLRQRIATVGKEEERRSDRSIRFS